MTPPRIVRDFVFFSATALAFAAMTAGAVQAAPAPAGMPQFGSVDISKVQTLSSRKAKYDADLKALADRLDYQFKQQASSVMLSKAEQAEMGTLLGKSSPTDTDKARISALQSQATTAAQELTDLQQKKDPTPADTSRLAALTSQYQSGQQALQEIGDQYQAQIKKLTDTDTTEFTRAVKDAITAVAEQKGLAVVFTADIAVYTANDITDEVVKRINK